VSEVELWFFYYLIDESCDVAGVLTVNKHLREDMRYRGHLLRQVTEVEHDTMAAFGIRKFTHNANDYPFLDNIQGHIHDIRT
jgi:hypothetical protein